MISVPKAVGTPAQLGANAAAWAESKVGIKESPEYSNHIFVWDDMYPEYQGEPWCAAFAVDAWAHQGIDLRKLVDSPYYCPSLEAFATKWGVWHTYSSGYDPHAGDISLMGRDGYASHAGVPRPTTASYSGYRQVEGNTVAEGSSGSQTNGDGVYVRFRGDFIRGWVDMQTLIGKLASAKLVYVYAASGTVSKNRPVCSFSALMHSVTGPSKGKVDATIKIVQGLLRRQSSFSGIKVTGIWDAQTKIYYRKYQVACGYKGSDADGIPGWSTFSRLVNWGGYAPVK